MNLFKELDSYLRKALAVYQAIQNINTQSHPLKIVEEIDDPKENIRVFVVQLSGKNIFMRFSETAFVKNPNLSRLLSEADQQKIEKRITAAHTLRNLVLASINFHREKNIALVFSEKDDHRQMKMLHLQDFKIHPKPFSYVEDVKTKSVLDTLAQW